MTENTSELQLGLDIGSTTVKAVIIDPADNRILWSQYERHGAKQTAALIRILRPLLEKYPAARFAPAVCGSGGQPFADCLEAPYVQEVVANALAIQTFYPDVRTAIELGGQDAKAIFFREDPQSGVPVAYDMRMNGSCAGGTGAFLDQVSELLNVPIHQMNSMAEKGQNLYNISGRCGVFAKTDIQPLLNQGVPREDIILSTFHALANQAIAGLTQGLTITPSVIFEGGPCAFNPRLISVFREKLSLPPECIILPDHPEIIVAAGTALFTGTQDCKNVHTDTLAGMLHKLEHQVRSAGEHQKKDQAPFFKDDADYQDFLRRHAGNSFRESVPADNARITGYLGIDAGSTTSKFVLIGPSGTLLHTFYANNMGDPIGALKRGLLQMAAGFSARGISLEIKGMGTTGYGEQLLDKAFQADFTVVETVAHAEAARFLEPDVSFILDIGGQDMKAIFLENGIITQIILNEACSAGCGSFLETFARSLDIPVPEIARQAFASEAPSDLGSRCTVFMNSRIITEQRSGKTPGDIMAGLCRSVVENVFTKVIRIQNISRLGSHIVVQGGTFKNDAVLRSFEQFLKQPIIRPSHPHLMGAIGIALKTKQFVEQREKEGPYTSRFLGLSQLADFSYHSVPGLSCTFCQNRCNRAVMHFSTGSSFITGNRCERGEVLGDPRDPAVKEQLREVNKRMAAVPDMFKIHEKMVRRQYDYTPADKPKGITIGLPFVLDNWRVLPFWKTLFLSLGFNVAVSARSSYPQFEKGLQTLPSDTVCFPAKLVHGHIIDLIEQKVDRIFFPMMIGRYAFNAPDSGIAVCAVVQGYPMVIDKNLEPLEQYGIHLDHPTFDWKTEKLLRLQVRAFLTGSYGIGRKAAESAITQGLAAQMAFHNTMHQEGRKILDGLRPDQFAMVIACRPYQIDGLISHNLSSYFTRYGIPVVTVDAFSHDAFNMDGSRLEVKNPVHRRMITGAQAVAADSRLEMAQVVSFGCGHDAILCDEITRIMKTISNKSVLQLKLDETAVQGPLRIRVRSFVTTIKNKRGDGSAARAPAPLPDPYEVKFTGQDKTRRKILIPNLSPSFSLLAAKILTSQGYTARKLDIASPDDIQLGKHFVNNDVCFPAQINIGEMLGYLKKSNEPPETLALGLARNCDNCRAGQYAALARKAMDEAGYPQVALITTGDDDERNMHPGYKVNFDFRVSLVWGLAMVDALESMLRAVRPYEREAGETDAIYRYHLEHLTDAVGLGRREMLSRFKTAVRDFNAIASDRRPRKPRVGLLGEIFLKYHPGANSHIEAYLERNGMEVFLPPMLDFFRRDDSVRFSKRTRNMMTAPRMAWLVGKISEHVYRRAVNAVTRIFKGFKYYEPHANAWEMQASMEGFMDAAFKVGEGWLIPAELVDLANHGVESFVIVQPFGCMPNHISGRGMAKALKKRFPHIQILSLDYDPDVSFANIENRLQMLILTAHENVRRRIEAAVPA